LDLSSASFACSSALLSFSSCDKLSYSCFDLELCGALVDGASLDGVVEELGGIFGSNLLKFQIFEYKTLLIRANL
jgi:hypothetical protein